MTLTPASAARRLEVTLSPIAATAAGGGPMKTIPAAASASANRGFSERKP